MYLRWGDLIRRGTEGKKIMKGMCVWVWMDHRSVSQMTKKE